MGNTAAADSIEREVAALLDATDLKLGECAEQVDALLSRIGDGTLREELLFVRSALVTARVVLSSPDPLSSHRTGCASDDLRPPGAVVDRRHSAMVR